MHSVENPIAPSMKYPQSFSQYSPKAFTSSSCFPLQRLHPPPICPPSPPPLNHPQPDPNTPPQTSLFDPTSDPSLNPRSRAARTGKGTSNEAEKSTCNCIALWHDRHLEYVTEQKTSRQHGDVRVAPPHEGGKREEERRGRGGSFCMGYF